MADTDKGSALSSYRWSRHRTHDGAGNDSIRLAPISLWWVARAAAEETLQGAPLVAAWLKLFREHLSVGDRYWLRWRGDLAESAEPRRAYSGLYGRFFARALLSEHLGFSRFLSLKRNGLEVPGAVTVSRIANGDLPDWLAWDDQRSKFVLCEAKGSLSNKDFLSAGMPSCVVNGKAQFDRVEVRDGPTTLHPARWVAATRWATETRTWSPATLLWDPPVDDDPIREEDARRYKEAATLAWLSSLAPGFDLQNADEILAPEREEEAILIKAKPGPVPDQEDWPLTTLDADIKAETVAISAMVDIEGSRASASLPGEQVFAKLAANLSSSSIYEDRSILVERAPEKDIHEERYIIALITPFGLQPVRSLAAFEAVKRAQDRAVALQQPAMLVGLPLGIDPSKPSRSSTWMDGAGFSQSDLSP